MDNNMTLSSISGLFEVVVFKNRFNKVFWSGSLDITISNFIYQIFLKRLHNKNRFKEMLWNRLFYNVLESPWGFWRLQKPNENIYPTMENRVHKRVFWVGILNTTTSNKPKIKDRVMLLTNYLMRFFIRKQFL